MVIRQSIREPRSPNWVKGQNNNGVVRATSTVSIEQAHSGHVRSGSTEVILTTPSSPLVPPGGGQETQGQGAGVLSIARNFFTRPLTGRYFSPALPSDCFAIDFPRRASSPGEGLPILFTSR
jgi:hypothetical protein